MLSALYSPMGKQFKQIKEKEENLVIYPISHDSFFQKYCRQLGFAESKKEKRKKKECLWRIHQSELRI